MTEKASVFLVSPDQGLIQMKPSAPANEDELQRLIADYPQLIGDADGGLLLVQREKSIPGSQDGAARWSIDHLFVTKQMTPVLVEVKRAVDTRLRREVVGQMMDYAANGVAYWPAGELQRRFGEECEIRNQDPVVELRKFTDVASAQFWGQVDTNLKGGRIKMIFVADEIPAELARIVEFMNEQMEADVRAIELKYFEGPGGVRTLAPRVIGETERTRLEKSGARPARDPIDVDTWLAKCIDPLGEAVSRAARKLLALMRAGADEVDVASTQGSIYGQVVGPNGKSSYPISLRNNGAMQVSFGTLAGAPALLPESARKLFYDRFTAVIGPLSSSNLGGYPSAPLVRVDDARKWDEFEAVVRDFFLACRSSATSQPEPSGPLSSVVRR